MMWRVSLAYVDPSVMTYTVQALAAVAVAFSAIAGVAMRRTRKALFRLLGVDENAGRVVEARASRVGEEGLAAADARAREMASALDSNGARADKPLGFGQRFWRAALAAFALMFTLFFMAPVEVVAGATGDVVLTPLDVVAPMGVVVVIGTLVLALLASALKGRAFNVALMLLAGLTLASYVQAAFMNGGLPLANGDTVPWGDYTKKTILTGAIWMAVLLLPVAASKFFGPRARNTVLVVLAALVVVQAVGAASVLIEAAPDEGEAEASVITADGINTLSPKKNTVIFVLDTYDILFLREVVARYPGILDEYTGFTWYTDSAGAMVPTALGLPFLLTQVYPQPGQTYHDFADHRYERGTYLADIGKSGFDFGLYSTTLENRHYDEATKRELIYQYTSNIHPIQGSFVDPVGAAGVLAQCALYRDLPWALKRFAWYYTEDINNRSINKQASHPYLFDDRGYYDGLLEEGLSIDENMDAPGALRLIHLLGSHVPWNLDADINYVGNWNSDVIQQSAACTRIVAEYLRQMKELGVYDSATIIVTADHGNFQYTDDEIATPENPILLVKQPGATGPIREDSSPASMATVHPTVIKSLGGDYAPYGTPADELPAQSDEPRIFFQVLGREDFSFFGIQQYEIRGDSNDIANWHRTDFRLEF